MKKVLVLLLMVMAGSVIAVSAKDKVTRDSNVLPVQAKEIIKKNFKANVHHIEIEEKFMRGKEYEVVLNDGTQIDFDDKGNWTSVDCGNNSVPDYFILKTIKNYVSKNYSGKKIVEVEKKSDKYEIQLSNDIELEFDRAGNFLRIDD